MADGPLAGVRVLDLTQVVSGPFCTQLLGDLGADVIKIEAPEGDSMRRNGRPERAGFSAAFINFNRNKRSIVIDVKKEHGRDLVRRLATRADALVENNRPGVADRLGIGYPDIRRTNPKIVYCSICGFAPKGKKANHPAYDPVIQGYSGIANVQGGKSGQPSAVKMALADKVSGMTAALGIVSALHAARVRGVGQYIRVPMLEAMMNFAANDTIYGYTFLPEADFKGQAPKSTTLDPFRTKDGWLTIAPFTDAQFERMCIGLGHPEWWTGVADRTERLRGIMRGCAKLFPRKPRPSGYRFWKRPTSHRDRCTLTTRSSATTRSSPTTASRFMSIRWRAKFAPSRPVRASARRRRNCFACRQSWASIPRKCCAKQASIAPKSRNFAPAT